MTFGKRLRQLREERGITQKALAAVLHISPRMVSFYESGAHFPRDEAQLLRLADYFEVTTDYLLGHSDIRFQTQYQRLAASFGALTEDGQKSLLDYLDFLLSRYDPPKVPNRSAHAKKRT